jgi:nitrous oxide reductase accessory protein NosL
MCSHHRVDIASTQPMARRSALQGLASALALSLSVGCKKENASDTAKAIPSKQKLSENGNPNPTADDRCPMCAMRVADHPQWVGAIELKNGDTFYTCSVRCTLATSMNTETFLGVPKNEVSRVRVPQYLEKGKSLDAETAWYVVDSDVRGPMGLALLPAATQEEAGVIVTRHKGRALPRSEVTMAVLKDLKQRSKNQ